MVLPYCVRGAGLGLEVSRWKLMHTVPRPSDSTTCARAHRQQTDIHEGSAEA